MDAIRRERFSAFALILEARSSGVPGGSEIQDLTFPLCKCACVLCEKTVKEALDICKSSGGIAKVEIGTGRSIP
jgi:hypothetical protein